MTTKKNSKKEEVKSINGKMANMKIHEDKNIKIKKTVPARKKISQGKAIKTEKKSIPLHKRLLYSTESFLNDLECARDMFDVVVPTLRKQDEKRTKEIATITNALEAGVKEKDLHKVVRHANSLMTIINKLRRAETMFRTLAIVCLISRYDQFLAEVLRCLFLSKPSLVTSPERSLSYQEILELESLDNALNVFINKEVDSILRESHQFQIEYIDNHLKLGLKEHFSGLSQFIEIAERRNLFVHNGGVVNKQYLKRCSDAGVEIDNLVKKGTLLDVTEEYFEKACRCLFELAVRIGHGCVRRLFPTELEEADLSLRVKIGFTLLERCQWDLAKIVYTFGLSLPEKYVRNDESRRYYIINTCICLQELGEKKEMLELLNKYDWSSQNDKFLLAVAILREEWKNAEEIMSKMSRDNPFSEHGFREWPIFRHFRETPEFAKAFKHIYGKEYKPKLSQEDSAKLLEAGEKSHE